MVALPITLNGAIEWEVECIVRYRILHRNRYFLVLFVGSNLSKAIWLSEDDLGNS